MEEQKRNIVLYKLDETITTVIVPSDQELIASLFSGLFSSICSTPIEGNIEVQFGDVINLTDGTIQYEVKERYPDKESFCKKMIEEMKKKMEGEKKRSQQSNQST